MLPGKLGLSVPGCPHPRRNCVPLRGAGARQGVEFFALSLPDLDPGPHRCHAAFFIPLERKAARKLSTLQRYTAYYSLFRRGIVISQNLTNRPRQLPSIAANITKREMVRAERRAAPPSLAKKKKKKSSPSVTRPPRLSNISQKIQGTDERTQVPSRGCSRHDPDRGGCYATTGPVS